MLVSPVFLFPVLPCVVAGDVGLVWHRVCVYVEGGYVCMCSRVFAFVHTVVCLSVCVYMCVEVVCVWICMCLCMYVCTVCIYAFGCLCVLR